MTLLDLVLLKQAVTDLAADRKLWRRGEVSPEFVLETLQNFENKMHQISIFNRFQYMDDYEEIHDKIEAIRAFVEKRSSIQTICATQRKRVWKKAQITDITTLLTYYNIERIAARIGGGCAKEVYLAITGDNREVVVKFYRSPDGAITRLPSNALSVVSEKHAAAFFHPNIARVLGRITYEDHVGRSLLYGLIQEAFLGMTLEDFFRTPRELTCIRHIMQQIFSALLYVNQQGFFYLDLKTDNVLINSQLTIKLVDFDFCNNNNDLRFQQRQWTYHLAPELKKNRAYDEKVDAWVFGRLLWELITIQSLNTAHYQAIFLRAANNTVTQQQFEQDLFAYDVFSSHDPLVLQAKNLIRTTMVLLPENRPRLEEVKTHPFLQS